MFADFSPALETCPAPAVFLSKDGTGVTHTVSVAASSLYEAAALAVAEFKRCGLALATVGPATRLKVAVEVPATVHELNVSRLQAWLEPSAKTPREHAVKAKLRQLLLATR